MTLVRFVHHLLLAIGVLLGGCGSLDKSGTRANATEPAGEGPVYLDADTVGRLRAVGFAGPTLIGQDPRTAELTVFVLDPDAIEILSDEEFQKKVAGEGAISWPFAETLPDGGGACRSQLLLEAELQLVQATPECRHCKIGSNGMCARLSTSSTTTIWARSGTTWTNSGQLCGAC